MNKTLVIVAHDNMENSKINKYLINTLNDASVDKHILKSDFDVKKEQELLLAHDNIVIQFPMQWFSTPAILKSWFDKVLTWGFAYGDRFGLEGKNIKFVVSTGGTEEAYTTNGQNGYTIEEFLLPLIVSAKYIKMNVLPTFVVHNVFQLTEEDLFKKATEYHLLLSSL